MKRIAAVFLVLSFSIQAQDLYPLRLRITSRRGTHIWGRIKGGWTNSEINGFCDEPVLVGTYRGRLERQHVVMLLVRTPGTEDTHEVSCKF